MWENQHYCLLGTSGMLQSRPCPILIFYMTWYQYTGNLIPQTRIRVIVLSTLNIPFSFSISTLFRPQSPITLLLAEEKKRVCTLGVCSKISIRGLGGSCHCFRKGKTEKSFARRLCTFKKLPVLGVVIGGIFARMLCGAASSIRERALFLSSSSPRRYQSSPLSPSDTSLGFELFVNIYKTRTRGMNCAVQRVQLSHSGRSVLVFGTIVQPVKGVFGAMPMRDGKNEYMTRKAPIKTAARASPLARAGLF